MRSPFLIAGMGTAGALALAQSSSAEVTVAGVPLPTVCLARLLGLACWTCGLTRGVIATAHGDIDLALRCHPLSPWVAGLLLTLVLVSWVRVVRSSRA